MLIHKISNFDNLLMAFKECSRGKKQKFGYQKYIFNYGEKLKSIENEITETLDFKWGGYREFYVHDPKKRIVMAAPFRDRIVHTAIHRVVAPLIDPTFGCRTYACRIGLGNRNAALRLQEQLTIMGSNRYCVKLDVKKYFPSINHELLLEKFMKALPDQSLKKIISSLINSHEGYYLKGRGIPIGNLTSQLFANFYLSSLDKKACDLLGINFLKDDYEKVAGYIRYMDDMVILSDNKEKALYVATQLVSFAKTEMDLEIPSYKYVVLGKDPVPFLGYVISENGNRPLRRNEKKFSKKLKRLQEQGYNLAHQEQVKLSYSAWKNLEKM